MNRRNFLSLFLLAPASVLAEDGLLMEAPSQPQGVIGGLLMEHDEDDGLLMEAPKLVLTENDLPELWYWSHEGCLPCIRFKNDYTKNKEGCEFIAVERKEQRPSWMTDSDPQFWWHVSEKTPTQKDVLNTRHIDGYLTWKDLTSRFKVSREPKKIQIKQAGGPAKDPFVRPDQPSQRAVARYHRGHDCPNCGKSQFNIENDAGPNHTHRCRSCSTLWFHQDQVRRSWFS